MNLRHSHAGPPNIMFGERPVVGTRLLDMAPHTPHRSDRPGKAVALLDTSTGSRAESRIILDKLRARA